MLEIYPRELIANTTVKIEAHAVFEGLGYKCVCEKVATILNMVRKHIKSMYRISGPPIW